MVTYLSKQLLIASEIISLEAANKDVVINGHLFKQVIAYCKQIVFFEAAI